MRNNNFYKVVFWVYVAIVAACILFGCNPVKQVLKDKDKIKQVWEAAVLDSWCVNDSVYVSDTTILLDTLHLLETSTDTVKIDSVVYITKTEYKTVTKTRDIEKKFYITDNSKIDLLQKKLIAKDGGLIEKGEQLEVSKKETKQARKERNKWRLYFFILLAAFAGWLLRKPILKLIKPL